MGNPPFGTKVANGDEDQLDGAFLDDFVLGCGKQSIQSEQIILEKSVSWLKPGGRLGMVLPDGVLNNSGSQSNCPALREWLFKSGRILSVISLPDFAFRRSGATNKTSILIFEKFSDLESARLGNQLEACEGDIAVALKDSGLDYNIFSGRHLISDIRHPVDLILETTSISPTRTAIFQTTRLARYWESGTSGRKTGRFPTRDASPRGLRQYGEAIRVIEWTRNTMSTWLIRAITCRMAGHLHP
ncbi:MAG: N-6 DNA methylase [Collinsella sp.]